MTDLSAPRPLPVPATVASPPGALADVARRFWGASRRTAPPRVLVACAAVGVLGGGVLVGRSPGVGAAVVGALTLVPGATLLVRRRRWADLVLLGLAAALLGVVALRTAGWVVGTCLVAAAGVAAVALTSARSAAGTALAPAAWAAGLVRSLPWLARGGRSVVGARRGQAVVVLRSAALTAGLLLVFGLLFASADSVFASYLPRADLADLPAQVVVAAWVVVLTAGATHVALAPPTWAGLPRRAARPARAAEWVVPLAALDVLVLGFVLVQVGGLLGGHRHVLETSGLSYAEYARQGFAQLAVATALTLAVVAVAARRAPRGTTRDRLVVAVTLGVLCVGTLGVVASALRRMGLYVDAFGLTRLRLVATVAEVVMGVALVLVLAAGVRWRAAWLPRAMVLVTGLAVLGTALANPDALIARSAGAAGHVATPDVFYVRGLSADAYPEIDALDEPLRTCLLPLHAATPPTDWLSWNLSRDQALGVPTRPELGACADVLG